jgi:hypothetical protein
VYNLCFDNQYKINILIYNDLKPYINEMATGQQNHGNRAIGLENQPQKLQPLRCRSIPGQQADGAIVPGGHNGNVF